jgi:hydroxymethylpyrimidine kinase/phosphomethylpyrimidine kinase
MSNGNSTPVVLAIGGLDPSGGAGIIADVSAIAAAGCKPAAAATSITFQNSDKAAGAEHLTADAVRRQVLAVLGEHNVAAVKTGMLPTAEIVDVVADVIADNGLLNLIIDTPLRSTSGFPLIDDNALKKHHRSSVSACCFGHAKHSRGRTHRWPHDHVPCGH